MHDAAQLYVCGPLSLGAKADLSHVGTISSAPYDVDAAIMLMERLERGIHVVSADSGQASRVTAVRWYNSGI